MSRLASLACTPAIVLASGLLFAPMLRAQSGCLPPFTIGSQTPFQATHYYSAPGQNNTLLIPQNLPATYRGFLTLCDLTTHAAIDVTQIDMYTTDDGTIRYAWGPAPGVAGGIGLVGQTVQVRVWTTADSWIGKATTPLAWTQVGSGTMTVAHHDQHSVVTLAAPITLAAGTRGFAVEVGPVTNAVAGINYAAPPYALHPWLLVAASAPGASLTAHDQFVSMTNLDITNQAFVTNPLAAPKSPNFQLRYQPAAGLAFSVAHGSGCYDKPRACYELFPGTPGTFDLGNTSFELVPSNGAYHVAATSNPVRTPTTPGLPTAAGGPWQDDSRSAVLSLGFTFPYPGGSTSSIVLTSNGNLFLDPANSGAQATWFEPVGVAGFLKGQPQFAPIWTDLDPTVGGSLHLDLDPTLQAAYVTWNNVADWNSPGSSNTFQVVLYASGRVEYRYGNMAIARVPAMVGWTSGWSANDPGETDFTAAMPFTSGDGTLPPRLAIDARPVLGSRPNLLVRDVPTGAKGFVMLGTTAQTTDLGSLGMPGCTQWIDRVAVQPFRASGNLATVDLHIPPAAVLLGLALQAQAMVDSPGSNTAGKTVSNALCLRLGN